VSESDVPRIVEEWFRLEYAFCWRPKNPEALVEAVSPATKEQMPPIPFTPLCEIEKAIERPTRCFDTAAIVQTLVANATDRMVGRI
jgi:hypothetical protein